MATVVYLDADDEITSAASRIRVADEKRVALVVPYGSRLATSRINFRLLAREAQARGHRLSVVAGDAATRALAASAGLPVFASVNEYEEAETSRPASGADGAGAAPTAEREPAPRRRRSAAARTDGDGSGDAAAAGVGLAAAGGAAAAAATGKRAKAPPAVAARNPDLTQPVAVADRGSSGAAGTGSRPLVTAAVGATTGAGTVAAPAPGTFRVGNRDVAWRWGQTGAIVAAALIALGLLALAVGAFVLLPSAQAVVTLQPERIGPVPMDIRADPTTASIDVEAGLIPARRLTFDVAASGTFPATGSRVEETRARGEVTFLSKNPVDENNIGAGAIVSTPNGIAFRTSRRITIPKATIVGLTVIPGEASVSVEAVEPGPEGNVGAQAITVIPSNEDPTFTEVRNPSATRGGSREEFPLVQQADVDTAIAQLTAQLDEEFSRILADPGRIPPGLTVFGESRELAEPLPTTDPATLVGQEGAEFELGLSTTGSVTVVDARPVDTVAAERIGGSVDGGYRLVEGSIEVTAGEPEVTGQVVRFPVSATASQIRVLDAADLRDEIKGKPVDEARAILDQYGDVVLTVWPEWVSAIPTIDARLDVRVELPEGVDQPSATPSASPAASHTGGGSGSPPASGPAAPSTSGGSVPAGSSAPAVASPAASGASRSDNGDARQPSSPSP